MAPQTAVAVTQRKVQGLPSMPLCFEANQRGAESTNGDPLQKTRPHGLRSRAHGRRSRLHGFGDKLLCPLWAAVAFSRRKSGSGISRVVFTLSTNPISGAAMSMSDGTIQSVAPWCSSWLGERQNPCSILPAFSPRIDISSALFHFCPNFA